jgi:16S rRNA (uracil1498-N3)-methyltransferase
VPAVQPMRVRELASAPRPQSATLIIGPEGGWSPEEVRSALDAGCTPVTLGPLTLRAESAALAALAAVSVIWD